VRRSCWHRGSAFSAALVVNEHTRFDADEGRKRVRSDWLVMELKASVAVGLKAQRCRRPASDGVNSANGAQTAATRHVLCAAATERKLTSGFGNGGVLLMRGSGCQVGPGGE
jgi:hypothetical protein